MNEKHSTLSDQKQKNDPSYFFVANSEDIQKPAAKMHSADHQNWLKIDNFI